MNAQIRGINVAIRNANDGISLAQTAEGALATVSDVLQRMRELAIQAQNGSNGHRATAPTSTPEYQQLSAEVTRIAAQTKFNGTAIVGCRRRCAESSGRRQQRRHADDHHAPTVTTVTGGLTTAAARLDRRRLRSTPRDGHHHDQPRDLRCRDEPLQLRDQQPADHRREPELPRAAASWTPTSQPETANLSRAQILQQAGSGDGCAGQPVAATRCWRCCADC